MGKRTWHPRVLDRDFWEPEIRPVLEAHVAATRDVRLDLTDPAVLAALREPGPDPAPEPDGTWSAATVPNTAGDHDIPVRVYRPARPDPRRPGYVLFHGGGLSFGQLNTEHRRCVELSRACGAVGVSVALPDGPGARARRHPRRRVLGAAPRRRTRR